MANYKTRGIIIRRSNFGEADRLLVIFTERFGKIKAIAKGARKQGSKLAGNLELFCLTNFIFAEGRNLDIVTEAEIINCFFKIRNNLKSINSSFYLAEVIDKLSEEREAHPDVFHLLLNTLVKINYLPDKIVLPYFEINFLANIGYQPELNKCLDCGKKITPGKNGFDFNEGGLLCETCNRNAAKISDEAIKVLRLFLKHDIKLLEKLKLSDQTNDELIDIVNRYIKHIHQQEFKSRRFVL